MPLKMEYMALALFPLASFSLLSNSNLVLISFLGLLSIFDTWSGGLPNSKVFQTFFPLHFKKIFHSHLLMRIIFTNHGGFPIEVPSWQGSIFGIQGLKVILVIKPSLIPVIDISQLWITPRGEEGWIGVFNNLKRFLIMILPL